MRVFSCHLPEMSGDYNVHVQYILLAEFDIDTGSGLRHQYPNATGTADGTLAELMLPDGAHLRAEDWTIFFLNQKPPDVNDKVETKATNEHKPLLYVLNLVRTIHDSSLKRGAAVKAMAICTRHQYLHIYKPILMLAMDKYFQNPSVDVLASLYTAVNSMNLSTVPHLTYYEKQILRATDDKDMYQEKFIALNESQLSSQRSSTNLKANILSLEDADKKIPIERQPEHRISTTQSRDCHFFETRLVYDGIKLPIRVPLTMNPEEVGDFSVVKLVTTFSPSTPTNFTHPYHPHLDTQGPATHPIILLMNALLTQKKILFLGPGLSAGEVANYVLAACAIGSGCGVVLRGFTERAYPYTNLASVDELENCPGYIAGVTNSIFEHHPSWWDLLCNISTGTIVVSKDIAPVAPVTSRPKSSATHDSDQYDFDMPPVGISVPPTASLLSRSSSSNSLAQMNKDFWKDSSDNEFITDVLFAIQSHYSETAIRAKFQDYVFRFVRLAALYEQESFGSTKIGLTKENTPDSTLKLGQGLVFPDEVAKQRELGANVNRIEGWRTTISYQYYIMDFQKYLQTRPIKNIDIYRQISKLRLLKGIPDPEIETIYKAFLENTSTPDQMAEFLSYLPQHQGGLSSLGFGFFHPSKVVRQYTVDLFDKLSKDPAGGRMVQNLNRFQRLAYDRLSQPRQPSRGSGVGVMNNRNSARSDDNYHTYMMEGL